jgi:hypothetical protein
MATYKGIKGFKVDSLTSDPTTEDSVGQFYYNSTSNAFKYVQPGGVSAGTWASSGALNIGRTSILPSQGGTQTAAMAGAGGLPTTSSNSAEQYDGASWTAVNNVNNARAAGGGAGTSTATLIFGGNSPAVDTESFDGTNWTEVANLNTSVSSVRGTGTQTAAICVGGTSSNRTELWNGSAWTELAGNLNTARAAIQCMGISTAALAAGGSPDQAITESWNGSSWTEVGNLNTGKSDGGAAGIQTLGIVFKLGTNEAWDGTSWTEVNNLGVSREGISGCGTQTAAVAFGGSPGPSASGLATEEWTVPEFSIKTVTTS